MDNSAIAGRGRSATTSPTNVRTEPGHDATAAIALALMTGNPVPMLEIKLCIGSHAVVPADLPQHIGFEEAERQIDHAIESLIKMLNDWNGVPTEDEVNAAIMGEMAARGEAVQ
jgi:hypothetical protein